MKEKKNKVGLKVRRLHCLTTNEKQTEAKFNRREYGREREEPNGKQKLLIYQISFGETVVLDYVHHTLEPTYPCHRRTDDQQTSFI